MELMLAVPVVQSVSSSLELGVPSLAIRMGATRLHPVPEQGRQPQALSSPTWLGCTLGCLCKLSLQLTAGLSHFSSCCIPYVMFFQCSLSTGCLGILFLLTVPSLAWSELPALGWALRKPQGAAGVNAMVCSRGECNGVQHDSGRRTRMEETESPGCGAGLGIQLRLLAPSSAGRQAVLSAIPAPLLASL